MELLDFDRRQVLYPMVERVFGMGEETGSAKVPKSVGLPLDAGMDMALYVMNNHTDTPIKGVTFQLTIDYSPRNLVPKPTIVLPFKADVNIRPGAGDAFDLPPGAVRGRRCSRWMSADDCSLPVGICTTSARNCAWKTWRPARSLHG